MTTTKNHGKQKIKLNRLSYEFVKRTFYLLGMKFLKKMRIERKLLKIWLLENKVQRARTLTELALIRIQIFNLFWHEVIINSQLKSQILKFPVLKPKPSLLDENKAPLFFILDQLKKSYEQKFFDL